MLWFTADNHWGHANIIKYCKRPFASVYEMDEALVANWNTRVQPGDRVYHLGDVSFYRKPEETRALLSRLQGDIYLIRGNHDDKLPLERFVSVHDLYEIRHQSQRITLCHYAMRVWNRSHHGAFQLFGHSHGTLAGVGKSMDVGVDCNNYAPISFDEVAELMGKRQAELVDHHGNQ